MSCKTIFIACVALGVYFSYFVKAHSANLILNGSFENGFESWTQLGNMERRVWPDVALDGSYVLAFNWGNKSPNGSILQSFDTVPGDEYLLEFGYRRNGDPKAQTLNIRISDDTRANSILNTSVYVDSTTWSQFSHSFTANDTVLFLEFLDQATNDSYRVDTWLDNVSITAISSEPDSDFENVSVPDGMFALLLLSQAYYCYVRRMRRSNYKLM